MLRNHGETIIIFCRNLIGSAAENLSNKNIQPNETKTYLGLSNEMNL